jgi:hypothetical protein
MRNAGLPLPRMGFTMLTHGSFRKDLVGKLSDDLFFDQTDGSLWEDWTESTSLGDFAQDEDLENDLDEELSSFWLDLPEA